MKYTYYKSLFFLTSLLLQTGVKAAQDVQKKPSLLKRLLSKKPKQEAEKDIQKEKHKKEFETIDILTVDPILFGNLLKLVEIDNIKTTELKKIIEKFVKQLFTTAIDVKLTEDQQYLEVSRRAKIINKIIGSLHPLISPEMFSTIGAAVMADLARAGKKILINLKSPVEARKKTLAELAKIYPKNVIIQFFHAKYPDAMLKKLYVNQLDEESDEKFDDEELKKYESSGEEVKNV